jgi:hypothetical protein
MVSQALFYCPLPDGLLEGFLIAALEGFFGVSSLGFLTLLRRAAASEM